MHPTKQTLHKPFRPYLLILAVLALLIPIGYAFAQPKHESHKGPKELKRGMTRMEGMAIERLLKNREELKLTTQQVGQLEKMATDFQLQSVDQRAALQKARIELRSLTRDVAKADRQAVDATIDRIADLEANQHKARFAQRQALLELLTDTQEKIIQEKRSERIKELRSPARPRMMQRPGRVGQLGFQENPELFDEEILSEQPEFESEI